ncbi:MAG: bifunctional phosphopantothenoylcysteine decarboxylase/phosphopantothenate--cysteine ligase CoaBC [Deltaproteobacteria bacterium]
MMLNNKNVILGVTGGIAAYKALELIRLLKKEGSNVFPVMTDCAAEFVTPLSLSTLACNPVARDMFAESPGAGISHIELAEKADIVVVAPITANTIGKVACGIADNLLTTIIMATQVPKVFAPAMNSNMYENRLVRANVEKLKALGYLFVEPEEGELACGWEGKGRLANVSDIVEAIKEALSKKDLLGEKVLVTAGATREPIDPVRFVSNASSGKMGYAIARAAKRRGAEVALVSGPSYLPAPPGITLVKVESAEEMREAAIKYFERSTVVIMAAAVSDFKPKKSYPKKVKKGEVLTIELERTPDILKEMGSVKKGQLLVGFALETDNLIENAKQKLRDKNLDMVIANPPLGLSSEVNEVTIIDSSGKMVCLPLIAKDELAEMILDKVVERLKE